MNFDQFAPSFRNKEFVVITDKTSVTVRLKHPIYTTEIVLMLDSKMPLKRCS